MLDWNTPAIDFYVSLGAVAMDEWTVHRLRRRAPRPRWRPRHHPGQAVASRPVMERFGLVGLPNAGKSSLYNALTGGGALAAPYAFATTDPNVGVAKVPDDRLDALAEMSRVEERRARGGAVRGHRRPGRGGQQGRGAGQPLPRRHPRGRRHRVRAAGLRRRRRPRARPIRSSTCASSRSSWPWPTSRRSRAQLSKRRKAAKPDKSLADEVAALERAYAALADGTPALPGRPRRRRRASCCEPYFLLTNKPVLAVVNVGEDELDRRRRDRSAGGRAELGGDGEVLGMCVQLEAEAAAARRATSGPRCSRRSAWARARCPALVRAAYHLLGLRTFFTTGDKESRAWTFRAGAKAPECAGVIHTDFQRGFIRAEVIHWDELLEIGSWSKAKEVGQAPGRGQGLRGRRRRRAGDPLQRLMLHQPGPAVMR